jgi:hypothetical protein
MKTTLDILKYNFPDMNQIEPESLIEIAKEIDDCIRERAKEDETFYLFDHMAKTLYPLCAYDLMEAYSEAFSMDLGYGVTTLDKEDLELYKKDGWVINE